MTKPCPAVTKVDASTSIDTILEVIERDGLISISGLLGPKGVSGLRGELDHQFDRAKFCEGRFFGYRTKRIHSLVAKSEACRNMIMQPLILQIMNSILGPSCDKIQLNLTQGIQIWPGEPAQTMHRDDNMFPMKVKSYELMLDVMWAYSEFTKENGATVVVPGSHLWDRDREPEAHEMTQAEMDPGDVLIYLGSLLHSGGANRSSAPRTGIVISYCLGWLRQFENQYLVAPPEVSRHYPRPLQDLLGYCVHRPNLGMYEGTEPSVLFDPPANGEIITRDCLTPELDEIVKQQHSVNVNAARGTLPTER